MNEVGETMSSVYEDIKNIASSLDLMMGEAFTQYMGDILTECQVVDDYYLSPYYNSNIGARIDAYELDEDTITLFTTHWINQDSAENELRVSTQDLLDARRRCLRFFEDSRKGKLPGDRIDVGSPAYDVATHIFQERHEIDSLKIIILTNGKSKRHVGKNKETEGVNVLTEVWDAQRIHDYKHNKETRGASITFEEYDGPISCVEYTTQDNEYTTYLAFVPGEVLADMYARHKTRLLEKNVRVFLSQRRKVNIGIRDTIRNEPQYFCAYNNGITVVAEQIGISKENDILKIKHVKDFQIVNGGQTTASLYHTRKKYKSDLSKIYVQMKLMVINDEATSNAGKTRLADELIPMIGKYSNTQNKVTMSDLSANEKPHPDLHNISRSTPARDPTGGTMNTYWFYENSRGKWDELRRHESTPARRKIFDSTNPKSQLFDKGMFARVWYSHLELPHIVSKGPQKCFAAFQSDFVKNMSDDEDLEAFFKKTIALLIMWKKIYSETRRRIRSGDYYGFAQNITTYTIAIFSHKNPGFDLYEYIWEKQELLPEFFDYLMELANKAHDHLVDLPVGVNLVPEHAKKESCWDNFKKSSIRIAKLPNLLHLQMKNDSAIFLKSNTSNRDLLTDEDVIYCMRIEGRKWREISVQIDFWRKTQPNSSKEISQCMNMAKSIDQGKTPSNALSKACRVIHERAVQDGWRL